MSLKKIFNKIFTRKNLYWQIPLVLLIVVIVLFCVSVISAASNIFDKLTNKIPALALVGKNISPEKLRGEGDGRINILLIGIPGGNYDGPNLSDTIMVASVDPNNKTAAMLSIPRDLYITSSDYGSCKINMIHAFAENQKRGSGPAALKKVVSELLDLPIHYYARLDFTGFIKAIDTIGGITVNVEKDINDYYFPDNHGGYDPFYLKAGVQKLDGQTALKYVRSRQTSSDFDRARRQQQVIMAAKSQVLKLNFLANPLKVNKLISIFGDHFKTDMEIWEMLRLWDLIKDINSEKIVSKVLDLDSKILYSTTINGMYVLYPVGGNYNLIKEFAHQIFIEPYLKMENAKIEIQNGTWRTGLATTLADFLKTYGYNVVSVKNASKKDYQKTLIIDYTGGKKPFTVNLLSKRLNAATKQVENKKKDIDILIILGADYTP